MLSRPVIFTGMRRLLLLLLPISVFAQKNSPLYWQNRKPDAAYWQQDIHCTIYAKMDEMDHHIDGEETLIYTNNSPDTLREVFFHLYQNAFVKGSYLHNLEKEKGLKPKLGKHEAAGEGIVVEYVAVPNNFAATGVSGGDMWTVIPTELDNTILKIKMWQPLLPSQSDTFKIRFKTWYDSGSTRRRMAMYDAWGFKHYNGCQWYPKICVYDRKFGWDTYQHLNKEFYGEFGTFDVSLDFPKNYVVEATGVLQNREEALPASLREKLDVKNFATKKMNEAPSVIIPYVKGERKIWKYHAENVHDFAFTADPAYRISSTIWNGIECVGIVQEPHAAGWQNSAQYVAKIIKMFSENIGPYGYPKMVAADANDGMEYPMLTLDGGTDPGYRGLLIHEIGHNWFYGMVGSNETYRAALDEGFTQYLTGAGLKQLEGEWSKPRYKSRYRNFFTKHDSFSVVDRNVLNPYTVDALNGGDATLATHSNDFHDALGHEGGYRLVYYKTASMLYNLEYVLGDSLFKHAMQHYFNQWKFAHPYFEDFRASIIQYTHADLNWFFDEWIETTKKIDYKINDAKKVKGSNDDWKVTFQRTGAMQMPIDFTVTAKDGSKHSYYIPNTWFSKKTEATELPKWYGWSKIQPTYTATVTVPSGLREVQIDTSYRLADIDYTDNYYSRGFFTKDPSVITSLDGGLNPPQDRRHRRTYIRPDVWWNPIDGIKLGIHAEGSYLNTLKKSDVTIWWNTHVLQGDDYLSYKSEKWYARYPAFNMTLNLNTPVSKSIPKLLFDFHGRLLDGLTYLNTGMQYVPNAQQSISLFGKVMQRYRPQYFDYLNYPQEWSSDTFRANTSLNLRGVQRYNYPQGGGIVVGTLRTALLSGNRSDAFNYSYTQLEWINSHKLGKLELRTRLFGRFGTGTSLPYESLLYLSMANPEEQMEDKYTRTVGFVPDDQRGYSRYETNHYQPSGGLNLRGYAGYFAADERDGESLVSYKARSGASFNAELDFDELIGLKPRYTRGWLHVDAYLFADAGIMELSRYILPDFTRISPTDMWSDVRVDAGPGLAFTIKSWGVFEKARPLTLRVDFPVFINRPPYAKPQYGAFRYVVGVNRSF